MFIKRLATKSRADRETTFVLRRTTALYNCKQEFSFKHSMGNDTESTCIALKYIEFISTDLKEKVAKYILQGPTCNLCFLSFLIRAMFRFATA